MQPWGRAVTPPAKDIQKRDVAEMARVLGVKLPERWNIRAGWLLCLERARELRQPTLPLLDPTWCDGCMQRTHLCSCPKAVSA